MKHRIFVLCVLVVGFAATARAQVQALPQAQAPGTFTIKCNPNLVTYKFSTTQTVSAYECTTDATINGVAFKGLSFSQTNQNVTGVTKDWGVIVGTLTSGDMVFFDYQAEAQSTSATTFTGAMTYKIVGGTGSANGITGSGTCKAGGAQGKGDQQVCTGTYAVR
ncbi:MAG TPA: hypothetical protein VMT38_07640 [Terracidiphilus sp.]|nr:hypothetical protein [Terracidiphilus sp.]